MIIICIFVQLKRALYILFCFYFIYLAAMPCGDKGDCNEINPTAAQSTHQEEHQDEMCTPFCICSCCATHFLVKDFPPTLKPVAVINTVYTVHKESKISSAIISIWQPPKIA
jgi:hypothetical protein